MKIDDELIAYLEELSRLRLPDEEREAAKENLAGILEYMSVLDELNMENTEAVSHPFPFTNRFREDEAAPSFEREKLLANAPRQKDGCFRAPRTVEG